MRLVIVVLAIAAASSVAWQLTLPTPSQAPIPSRSIATAAATTLGAAQTPQRPAAAATTDGGFRFQTALEYRFRRGEGFHDAAAIAIADLDGDGREDLVATTRYNQILVWRQRPDGALAELTAHAFASDNYSSREELVVADFNSDGIPDVVTPGLRQEVWGVDEDVINLLLSTPGGTPVQRQQSIHRVRWLSHWQLMDVNRDGRWDIVGSGIHEYPPGTDCGLAGTITPNVCPVIGVLYGDGRGGFARYEVAMVGAPHGISETEVGDVDGDGLPDLIGRGQRPFVYGVPTEHDVWVFRQRKGGGLEPLSPVFTMVADTASITAGQVDSDADHRVDLLSFGISMLRVHRTPAPGQSLPAYDPPAPWDRRSYLPDAVLVQDIDGDRRGDAIAGQVQDLPFGGIPQIAVYLQRDGILQEPFYTNAPAPHYGRRALAVGDLNGDGCKDLAIAGANSTLGLLYGTGCVQRRPIAARRVGIAGRVPNVHVWQRVPPGDRAASRLK